MNYFELVAHRMDELGFYNYLFPFILVTAVVYAILRQRKILGESSLVNGLVAVVLGFMAVFGFPIATGFTLGVPLSAFFMQISIFVIIFFIGLLVASFFYPNLAEFLPKVFTHRTTLFAMIALAFGLFVTSGLVGVFLTGFTGPVKGPTTPMDVIVISAGIIIFIIMLIIAATIGRGGG